MGTSTGSDPPRPVAVTGGSGGVVAHCDELRATARRFAAVADDTLAATLTLHALLVAPAVVTSSVVDPLGFADFETELLGALDGWQGLGWAAVECAGIAAQLHLAADGYETADRVVTTFHDVALGVLDAGPAAVDGALVLARTGDPGRAAQAALARDPALADDAVWLLGLPLPMSALAGAVPDGHGIALSTGPDLWGVAGRPPRRLSDLISDLAQRNGDARHGEIDVRILTMANGTRRVIVDITGTKSWDPLPTHDVTSVTTNVRALVGRRTAYEGGVLAAMRRAGVRHSDAVMLVGHSEGGLVAVTAARDAVTTGEFDVTHVITAGAPIGRTVGALPGSVRVLALENSRDVVPHLDGRANPDRPNVTTASSARGDGTIVGDHDLAGAYLGVAGDVEASRDRSLRDFLRSARGYFAASTVETRTFQIQRRY